MFKNNTRMIDYDNAKVNILSVAYICGLSNFKQEGPRFTTKCPFCGASEGHFYLTPQDPGNPNFKNVYRCVKCGNSGSSLRLYAELHGLYGSDRFKIAYKEIMGYTVTSELKEKINYAKKEADKPIVPIANIDKRDYVYNFLINSLLLTERDFNNLFSRGLNEMEIANGGYVTLPKDFSLKKNICKRIINRGITLEGVPGFYPDKYNNWTFWTPKGGEFLVPVRDINGKIQGCQIRRNSQNKKRKYLWFSSSYMEGGCGANGFFHIHWNTSHSSNKVVVTEGPLKSDVASYLSNYTFLAYPGVGAYNGSAEILKKMGAKEVIIANDMDKFSNKYVMLHENNFKKYLTQHHFKFKVSEWDHKYKGIDDYLYHLLLGSGL